MSNRDGPVSHEALICWKCIPVIRQKMESQMDVHIAADTPRTTECGEDVIDISGTINKMDHLTVFW